MRVRIGAVAGSIPAIAGLLAIAAVGCGGDGAAACVPDRYALERAFEEHACLHTVEGPFETVAAAAPGASFLPELRNTHVAYTVEVPARDMGFEGAVMFKPRETIPFAFFLDGAAPMAITDPGGRNMCLAGSASVTACAGLTRVAFVELERLVEYQVVLGPSTMEDLLVVVEPVVAMEAAQ